METVLKNLNPKKSTGWDGISPLVFLLGANELARPLTLLYNSCIHLGEWHNAWKKGEWIPVFKEDDPCKKENYRPITVQNTMNKIFEQLLSNQLDHNFGNKLCDKLTAYRKNHSCHTALLGLTENWKLALDNCRVVGVLSTRGRKSSDRWDRRLQAHFRTDNVLTGTFCNAFEK